MTKTVKSILICPYTNTISLIQREQSLQTIYKTLSYGDFKVDTIDAVRFESSDAIYVDDAGAMVSGNPTWCFSFAPHLKLAGRGLLTGVDAEGDDADCKTSLEYVRNHLIFLDMVTTGDFGPTVELDLPNNTFAIEIGRPILKDKDA